MRHNAALRAIGPACTASRPRGPEARMNRYFQDDLHEEFGSWPLGYMPFGGADPGEIEAVGRAVGSGDDAAFLHAWNAAADRLAAEADAVLAKGHRGSARELRLRASAFRAVSFHPLYGAPTDPRLLATYRAQIADLEAGFALFDPPVQPQRIPFGDTTLPAYLIPAFGHAGSVRPLLILNNGYDATITDMYFASAVAALRRGYHCLLFDGPGQGGMLYEHGIPLRPDWEVVIRAVVDFALGQPIVDPRRIALSGWSLGGHLAPRGASGEPRLAALVADPGLWGIADAFREQIMRMAGLPAAAVADLGKLDERVLDGMAATFHADRRLRWKIVQRGFWTHGVGTLRDYFASAELFTLHGRAEMIRCPTLITQAEGDPLALGAGALLDALTCPKTLLRFTAAEGADGHCEMRNRSLLNRRVLDWLDETLAPPG
jgi:alpha-beta hydrolase superfamily lysophospholipase